VIKDVTLQTSLFYVHGVEGGGQQASLQEKNYDQYGGGLNLSYSLTKKVRISLNYGLTLRSSNVALARIHAEPGWAADYVHPPMKIAGPDNFRTAFHGQELRMAPVAVRCGRFYSSF